MTYRVVYERDESGVWVASVPSVRGCHTQGRTVEEAQRRIREALGLFVPNAEKATLKNVIHLPKRARRLVTAYLTRRKRVAAEEADAAAAARRAVKVLRGSTLKMSARDAGELLNLSHQRVHQIAHEPRRLSRKRTRG
jgi:predicted RNase H-like HicB family nuclease